MPDATPIYGFPFAVVGDSPNGPAQEGALALALETKIAAMDAILNAQITARLKGFNKPSANQVTPAAETILTETVTFNAVNGHSYLLLHTDAYALATGVPTGATWNFRQAAGATLTTAGTLIEALFGPAAAAGFNTTTRHTVFVAPSTGQFTVGVGYIGTPGTTVTHQGNSRNLTVVDVT